MVKDKKRWFNTFRTIIKLSVKSFKLRFDLYSVIWLKTILGCAWSYVLKIAIQNVLFK